MLPPHWAPYLSASAALKLLFVTSLQAELEELVKKEHAKIDSQDAKEKASENKGATAKASSASAPPEPKAEE